METAFPVYLISSEEVEDLESSGSNEEISEILDSGIDRNLMESLNSDNQG